MPGISTILKIGFATGNNMLKVADWNQKEHDADVGERDHLHRFFLVGRVLLIYLTVK